MKLRRTIGDISTQQPLLELFEREMKSFLRGGDATFKLDWTNRDKPLIHIQRKEQVDHKERQTPQMIMRRIKGHLSSKFNKDAQLFMYLDKTKNILRVGFEKPDVTQTTFSL